MYRETKNHIAKIAEYSRRITAFAERSGRSLKIPSGMSGSLANRPSTSANAASRTTPAAIGARTPAEPHPSTSLRTMP
jgi:hypothetical protein